MVARKEVRAHLHFEPTPSNSRQFSFILFNALSSTYNLRSTFPTSRLVRSIVVDINVFGFGVGVSTSWGTTTNKRNNIFLRNLPFSIKQVRQVGSYKRLLKNDKRTTSSSRLGQKIRTLGALRDQFHSVGALRDQFHSFIRKISQILYRLNPNFTPND